MRVAFPVYDHKGLDEEIFEHFGHAPAFLLVEVEDGTVRSYETVENPHSAEHGPGVVPSFLAKLDVDVLICRGMGGRARLFFQQLGIEVITGAQGKVRDVLEAYLSGELESLPYEPREKWHRH